MGTYEFFTFNNMNINNDYFMEICKAHPGCEGCPLKTEDKEINGTRYHCYTGRGEVR